MKFLKEFGIPLTPFFLELVFRYLILEPTGWWEYPNFGTLSLTYAFWSLFLITKVPMKSTLPSDREIEQSYQSNISWFTMLTIAGFVIFGMNLFIELAKVELPFEKKQLSEKFQYSVAFICIGYAAMSMLIFQLTKSSIDRMYASN